MVDVVVLDSEFIPDYYYEGKVYHIEIFYIEDQPIHAYASFQIDMMNECDDLVGFGEDPFDKNKAMLKAIKHLHSQFN